MIWLWSIPIVYVSFAIYVIITRYIEKRKSIRYRFKRALLKWADRVQIGNNQEMLERTIAAMESNTPFAINFIHAQNMPNNQEEDEENQGETPPDDGLITVIENDE